MTTAHDNRDDEEGYRGCLQGDDVEGGHSGGVDRAVRGGGRTTVHSFIRVTRVFDRLKRRRPRVTRVFARLKSLCPCVTRVFDRLKSRRPRVNILFAGLKRRRPRVTRVFIRSAVN